MQKVVLIYPILIEAISYSVDIMRMKDCLLFSDSKTVFEAPKETDMSSREVARTSASLDLIEPIASPNEEESDDSGSGSDSEAEALEDGEIQSE